MNPQRRRFLGQLAAGAALAGLAGRGGLRLERAMAAAQTRRHLINVSCWGGVDAQWFHSAFPSSRLESHRGTHGADIAISSDAWGFSPLGAEQLKAYKLSIRHDEQFVTEHPHSPGNYLGYGMTNVFGPDDLRDLLIWKGLAQEGQHGVGNTMLNQGVSSAYAISYTAFVADKLNDDYPRSLPYVAIASAPGNLYLNMNMNRGAQVPVCIPNWDEFRNLTRPLRWDFASGDRRALINAAVNRLTGDLLGVGATLASTRKVIGSFASSFGGAATLATSGYGDSIEFKYVHKQYVLELVAKATSAHKADLRIGARTLGAVTASRGTAVYFAREMDAARRLLQPLPDLAAYLSLKAAAAAAPGDEGLQASLAAMTADYNSRLTDFVTVDLGTSYFFPMLRRVAFQFALAEFLVRNDLAGVVDLGTEVDENADTTGPNLGGDAHGANLSSILTASYTFAAFRLLMSNLRNHILPDGRNLLQATTLVMHTELDREPFLTPALAGPRDANPGTNHGYTTTVFLAGGGVKGGRVVGDMHHGPAHLAAFGDPGRAGYCTPLPIDLATGRPKPLAEGGRLVSTKALFPTIFALFGMRVPEQQVTEFEAVPAIYL
jgi:hypothetical protein